MMDQREKVDQLAAKKSPENYKGEDEFMSAWDQAAQELEEAKERCKAFSQEHQARTLAEQARLRAEAMTDTERQALLQAVEAVGIESEEKVHNG